METIYHARKISYNKNLKTDYLGFFIVNIEKKFLFILLCQPFYKLKRAQKTTALQTSNRIFFLSYTFLLNSLAVMEYVRMGTFFSEEFLGRIENVIFSYFIASGESNVLN